MKHMRLHLICAGTPTPAPTRFGTCYVLNVGADYLMFDCGPAATWKLTQAGILPTQIGGLFLTHHHYDHNADYPCFLLTRWNHHNGREAPLRIWGPPPTAAITERLVGENGVFADDWTARVNHPASQRVHVERGGTLPRPRPAFQAADAEPGPIMQGAEWRVSAARGRHADPWLKSLAYRVDAPEGSIVITGDAAPDAALHALARGADTILVNCWDHQDAMGPDHGISGTLDAAELAAQAGARRLILAHATERLTRPGSRERGIAQMARRFDGEIVFGEEGMALNL
jgi:ribonuclease BN (tRNA processing enzyme)